MPAKKRGGGGARFTLGCGCKDAKSVSVSVSVSASPSDASERSTTATRSRARATQPSSTDTLTVPSASSCSLWEEAEAQDDDYKLMPESSAPSTPSFSGLLRQLGELERSVMSWETSSSLAPHVCPSPPRPPPPPPPPPSQHRSSRSDRGGIGGGGGRLEESVAVVKESDDPLEDFRRSMLQMIVEKEIVAGEELRELLRRFLELNAPQHHDVILQAFAEIWEEVFAAYGGARRTARRR